MRKKGKLYTANKWNQPLFMPEEGKNLYLFGSTLKKRAYAHYQANPWDYTNDYMIDNSSPSIVDQYKQTKDYSEWNQQRKEAIGRGIGQAASLIPDNQITIGNTTYRRGLWDAADPVYHLADGRESEVGNTLSDFGTSLTKSSLDSGQWYGALAGAGLKIVGGLVNAGWGVKENKENIAKVNQATGQANQIGNVLGKTKTNEDVLNVGSMMSSGSGINDWSDLYENGWFTNKGTRKGKELIAKEQEALAYQNHALGAAANNADKRNDAYIMQHFNAYGGPLTYMAMNNNNGMNAIDYGFMSDYLAAKNQQNQQKNNMTNMFAGTASTMFGGGGKIHINPKNKGKFNATKKRTGKTTEELTHSKNPLTRKRAIFALNSRKWHHANGGPLNVLYQEDAPLFALGGDLQMHGGDYAVGQIYNVSEEEANRLKAMGYEFKVIS